MVGRSMRPYAPRMSTSSQRVVALLLLLVAGVLSLPVVAYFFDDQGTENWIIPVKLLVMALLGALVGLALPGLAGAGATPLSRDGGGRDQRGRGVVRRRRALLPAAQRLRRRLSPANPAGPSVEPDPAASRRASSR